MRSVKLSPLDIYKIASSIVFLGLGGFFVYQGLVKHGFTLWLGFGIVILGYGIFRIWVAVRLIHKIYKSKQSTPS